MARGVSSSIRSAHFFTIVTHNAAPNCTITTFVETGSPGNRRLPCDMSDTSCNVAISVDTPSPETGDSAITRLTHKAD